jgi:hypothetical protein
MFRRTVAALPERMLSRRLARNKKPPTGASAVAYLYLTQKALRSFKTRVLPKNDPKTIPTDVYPSAAHRRTDGRLTLTQSRVASARGSRKT